VKIINSYIQQHPNKITLLDYPRQGGACRNFLSMLKHVEAPYYMFCDQDDVWLPEKIARSMTAMQEQESHQPEKTIVVCTDLFITDEQLSVTEKSMFDYLNVYPEYIRNFNDSGASAVVTGCTMFFNQKAKDSCLDYQPAVIMHDCWLCHCALRQQGVLYAIRQPMVYYRQHGNNSLGAGVKSSAINLRYRIMHFKELYQFNINYYHMLSALGYGSLLKYLRAKFLYRHRIKRGYY
jgi:glycosyltransferase involved in cell wall biosynthesis